MKLSCIVNKVVQGAMRVQIVKFTGCLINRIRSQKGKQTKINETIKTFKRSFDITSLKN